RSGLCLRHRCFKAIRKTTSATGYCSTSGRGISTVGTERAVSSTCALLLRETPENGTPRHCEGPMHQLPGKHGRQRSRRPSGNRSMREWAHLRLSQRFQLPSELPEQYFYDVLQLCARVNKAMTEEEKLRQLTRGLRPEMLERVVLANPQTSADFLGTLQRLTQASEMAKHNMWAMPSHPLPGFNTRPS
ncbi:unnamed protein product, partial [Ixodes pacificus]